MNHTTSINRRNIKAWLWPTRPGRCLLLALAVMPCLVIFTILLDILFGGILRYPMFILVVLTTPLFWIYALALWFRGFFLRAKVVGGLAMVVAVLTLPILGVAMAAPFALIPLGLVSSEF